MRIVTGHRCPKCRLQLRPDPYFRMPERCPVCGTQFRAESVQQAEEHYQRGHNDLLLVRMAFCLITLAASVLLLIFYVAQAQGNPQPNLPPTFALIDIIVILASLYGSIRCIKRWRRPSDERFGWEGRIVAKQELQNRLLRAQNISSRKDREVLYCWSCGCKLDGSKVCPKCKTVAPG